jgi:hypothetical protein
VKKIFIHVYINGKAIPAETVPGKRGEGIKENDGGAKFKYDVL